MVGRHSADAGIFFDGVATEHLDAVHLADRRLGGLYGGAAGCT